MPKYNQYSATAEYEAKRGNKTIHPVWRGVGFVIMVIIPIVAYFLATWLLTLNAANNWIPIPHEFLSKSKDELVYVKVGLTLLASLIVYGLFMILGTFTLSIFGPPRYGEMDMPPVKSTGTKKRWE
jgi:hypothetical protein